MDLEVTTPRRSLYLSREGAHEERKERDAGGDAPESVSRYRFPRTRGNCPERVEKPDRELQDAE